MSSSALLPIKDSEIPKSNHPKKPQHNDHRDRDARQRGADGDNTNRLLRSRGTSGAESKSDVPTSCADPRNASRFGPVHGVRAGSNALGNWRKSAFPPRTGSVPTVSWCNPKKTGTQRRGRKPSHADRDKKCEPLPPSSFVPAPTVCHSGYLQCTGWKSSILLRLRLWFGYNRTCVACCNGGWRGTGWPDSRVRPVGKKEPGGKRGPPPPRNRPLSRTSSVTDVQAAVVARAALAAAPRFKSRPEHFFRPRVIRPAHQTPFLCPGDQDSTPYRSLNPAVPTEECEDPNHPTLFGGARYRHGGDDGDGQHQEGHEEPV